MPERTAGGDARYWAFISYSHRDAAFGRRLHRRLENYALPRRLVGRNTAHGAVPKKLAPIFRDREELPAAHDLSAEVRAALKASRSLIVVCSPSSAASQWVGREIEVFRELHPGRPILAALRDGEPADCFPEALHGIGPGGVPIEPLAADFRRGRDGEHLGLLKLVAGIIGLGLDELVQRDAHRRNQRVTAVTAAALAAVIVMSVLTGYALNARHEAERQRAEAEGLVEYMLTDLRDKLKGVGRLDVMTAVNERALKYYRHENLERLPANSLEQRARILHAMGDDDETRGRGEIALSEFREARRTTTLLLAEAPDDPERILDQAQSDYFIGSHEFNGQRYEAARRDFLAYEALTKKLVSIDPKSAKYHREVGYAETNLCAVAEWEEPADPPSAIRYCAAALTETELAIRGRALTGSLADDLLERHAWLADAYYAARDFSKAKQERLVEERLLNGFIASDPQNMDLRDTWVVLQRALAKIAWQQGETADARARLMRAQSVVNDMIRFDKANGSWAQSQAQILQDLTDLDNPAKKELRK
ncbi:MAG TPA: toll/interleukin-1 receptor domain-containing protein [Rhizomicrobium sp.]|nr:toll/interleukin-1 receptor domain-containing protein [Rhizomicrobium sp.]